MSTQPYPDSPAPPAPAGGLAREVGSFMLLAGVSWRTYESLLGDFAYRSSVRFTYDRGSLQITSPSLAHERYAITLGQYVRVLATEAQTRHSGFGSTTFCRQDRQCGLEPDQCFYLASLARILGKRTLDLPHDPPPDLALEIDLPRSALNRLAIYAALEVPEVWRFDGEQITCHCLSASGGFEERPFSPTFPSLRVADLRPFLDAVFDTDDESLEQTFRTWLRAQMLPVPTLIR